LAAAFLGLLGAGAGLAYLQTEDGCQRVVLPLLRAFDIGLEAERARFDWWGNLELESARYRSADGELTISLGEARATLSMGELALGNISILDLAVSGAEILLGPTEERRILEVLAGPDAGLSLDPEIDWAPVSILEGRVSGLVVRRQGVAGTIAGSYDELVLHAYGPGQQATLTAQGEVGPLDAPVDLRAHLRIDEDGKGFDLESQVLVERPPGDARPPTDAPEGPLRVDVTMTLRESRSRRARLLITRPADPSAGSLDARGELTEQGFHLELDLAKASARLLTPLLELFGGREIAGGMVDGSLQADFEAGHVSLELQIAGDDLRAAASGGRDAPPPLAFDLAFRGGLDTSNALLEVGTAELDLRAGEERPAVFRTSRAFVIDMDPSAAAPARDMGEAEAELILSGLRFERIVAWAEVLGLGSAIPFAVGSLDGRVEFQGADDGGDLVARGDFVARELGRMGEVGRIPDLDLELNAALRSPGVLEVTNSQLRAARAGVRAPLAILDLRGSVDPLSGRIGLTLAPRVEDVALLLDVLGVGLGSRYRIGEVSGSLAAQRSASGEALRVTGGLAVAGVSWKPEDGPAISSKTTTLSVDLRSQESTLWLDAVEIDLGQALLDVRGQVDLSAEGPVELRVGLEGIGLAPWLGVVGIELPPALGRMPFSGEFLAQVALPAKLVMTGKGELGLGPDENPIGLQVQTWRRPGLDTSFFASARLPGASASGPAGTLEVKGQIDAPRPGFETRAPVLEIDVYVEGAELDPVADVLFDISREQTSSDESDSGFDLSAHVHLDRSRWREIHFEEFVLNLSRKGDVSEAVLAPSRLLDGTLQGRLQVVSGEGEQIAWKLEGEKLAVGPLANSFQTGDSPEITGRLDLTSEAAGASHSREDLQRQIVGDVAFYLRGGQLRGSGLLDFLARNTGVAAFRDLSFTVIEARLRIEEGVAKIRDAELQGPVAVLVTTGQIGLDGALALRVSPRVGTIWLDRHDPGLLAQVTRMVGDLAALPMVVTVGGELASPSYGVDTGSTPILDAGRDLIVGAARGLGSLVNGSSRRGGQREDASEARSEDPHRGWWPFD